MGFSSVRIQVIPGSVGFIDKSVTVYRHITHGIIQYIARKRGYLAHLVDSRGQVLLGNHALRIGYICTGCRFFLAFGFFTAACFFLAILRPFAFRKLCFRIVRFTGSALVYRVTVNITD